MKKWCAEVRIGVSAFSLVAMGVRSIVAEEEREVARPQDNGQALLHPGMGWVYALPLSDDHSSRRYLLGKLMVVPSRTISIGVAMFSLELINHTADHVKTTLSGEGSGHDWWHTYRVWRTAQRIGAVEKGDLLVVELAALLHDIADWKAHGGDSTVGPETARQWLVSLEVDESLVDHVCRIIANISFKGAGVEQPELSLEGKVVQDADRLDAIGAIGIARAFAYGGAKGRLIHDPDVKPAEHRTAEEYIKSTGTTINHFYEKLFLLKDRMNTATGRAIAEKRQRFMEKFLRRFSEEWEGG